MVHCSAFGCRNKSMKGTNISFHCFPNDPVLRKQWITGTQRQNFQPTKHSRLCSQHFLKDDFEIRFGRITIKPNVVPSIFTYTDDISSPTTTIQTVQSPNVTVMIGEHFESKTHIAIGSLRLKLITVAELRRAMAYWDVANKKLKTQTQCINQLWNHDRKHIESLNAVLEHIIKENPTIQTE